MEKVVNKSFNKVRTSIARKSDKLLSLLQDKLGDLYDDDYTKKQDRLYRKLGQLTYSLAEEIDNLDEVPGPDLYGDEKL